MPTSLFLSTSLYVKLLSAFDDFSANKGIGHLHKIILEVQVIHARCDDVLRLLAEELDLSEQNPSLVSSNRALEHDVGVHEDMSSECYDQKLEEFERSFMVQTTSFAPRT